MNRSILFITIVIVVVGILFTVVSFLTFEPTRAYTQGNESISSSVSMQELSTHNTQANCWVGYNAKAYDLTSWLPRHPGTAAAIAPYCGTSTEFQQAFAKQHGTSKASLFMKVAIYKGDLV